jgi:hypothetical protein
MDNKCFCKRPFPTQGSKNRRGRGERREKEKKLRALRAFVVNDFIHGSFSKVYKQQTKHCHYPGV